MEKFTTVCATISIRKDGGLIPPQHKIEEFLACKLADVIIKEKQIPKIITVADDIPKETGYFTEYTAEISVIDVEEYRRLREVELAYNRMQTSFDCLYRREN